MGGVYVSDQTLELFLQISKHRVMDNYLPKIRQCLKVIDMNQLWGHEKHETNSIGGILLHICEQVSRHTAGYEQHGQVSTAGVEDYFPDMKKSSDELLMKLEKTFSAWSMAIDGFINGDIGTVDFFSIYHLVEHTSYHLGQIVDRIQRKTGVSFQFVQHGLNERGLRKIIENMNNPTGLT